MEGNNHLLTPGEVAEALHIHVFTVYGYIRRGKLPAVRLGRTYRILPDDLHRFIESNRVCNSSPGAEA